MKLQYFILAMLCPLLSMCQTITIKGKVVNEEGEAVVGAVVRVVGQESGVGKGEKSGADSQESEVGKGERAAGERVTVSDDRGEFLFTDAKFTDTIVVSAVGYETVREVNNARGLVTITLKRDVRFIDELIVSTGYEPVRRKLTTTLLPYPLLQKKQTGNHTVDDASTEAIYYSEFSASGPGASVLSDSVTGDRHHFTMINTAIIPMYVKAFGLPCLFPASRVWLRVIDSSRFLYAAARGSVADWNTDNRYCYRAVFSTQLSFAGIQQKISSDLDLCLGLQSSFERIKVKCLVLRNADSSKAVAPLPAPWPSGVYKKTSRIRSMAVLLYFLNRSFIGMPVLDETTGTVKPDLRIDPLQLYDLRKLQAGLLECGLQLQPAEREVEMLVIGNR